MRFLRSVGSEHCFVSIAFTNQCKFLSNLDCEGEASCTVLLGDEQTREVVHYQPNTKYSNISASKEGHYHYLGDGSLSFHECASESAVTRLRCFKQWQTTFQKVNLVALECSKNGLKCCGKSVFTISLRGFRKTALVVVQ
jgi:hypothetical protein